MIHRLLSHVRTVFTFGPRNWFAIVRGNKLRTQYALYPLEFRRNTSDLSVFRQVFSALEYASVPGEYPSFVLDFGANVGYTSAYFLTRFPQAEVMAVEPDPDNFAVLVRNLAPYGSRARAINGAVWSHATRLSMAASDYRDGEAWAKQVCEGGDEVPAFGVTDFLQMAGRQRVDILKMDIEGAEAVVFAHGAEAWIDLVDVMAVELHDDTTFGPASEIVARATTGFTAVQSGELTIYRQPEQHL